MHPKMMFTFENALIWEVDKEIRYLNECKTAQQNNILVRIIKSNSDILSELVMITFNNAIIYGKFPNLSEQTTTPDFKTDSRDEEEK